MGGRKCPIFSRGRIFVGGRYIIFFCKNGEHFRGGQVLKAGTYENEISSKEPKLIKFWVRQGENKM